ncbi:MAG: helix-turn-helix transcriptional regulator [Clostridia bacterium]|nr:helix-turn-helix transcriptional regulator [Clostridia bacterium]
MDDIKNIIAKNLTTLRKKHNLTQNDLAKKLNYSDNAVSRWEHAEVTPSIETLQQISEIYGVPLRSIIEDNAVKVAEVNDRKQLINKLAIMLISVSVLWLISTIVFVGTKILFDKYFWQIYIWSIPVVCLVMLPFNEYWGRHIYKFVIFSIAMWSLMSALYIQFGFLNSMMWLIFIIGIPIQIALAIWAFVKPKPKTNKFLFRKKKDKQNDKENHELTQDKNETTK